MDEKQFQQANDNLTKPEPAATPIAELLKDLLSAKCENCGSRVRLVEKGVVKKWCSRCIDAYRRSQELLPSKVAEELAGNVGEAYIDADIDTVEIGKQLLAAEGDIFLHGDVGVGKTWAMAALLKEFICQGYICKRVNFDEFCCRVRATINSKGDSEHVLIKSLVEVDKLFIDDIGLRSKTETDFAYVTFYSILNKRQEYRLPTYISTNKTIEQLATSFDQRIASRLGFATIIEMKGVDRRLKE